jgi:hypothetical protein
LFVTLDTLAIGCVETYEANGRQGRFGIHLRMELIRSADGRRSDLLEDLIRVCQARKHHEAVESRSI